ncbi:Fatty acyl-CoA reductase [Corchorus olitorius]|uniref:Fatty acyl-CoA reductase n=1 Tax=Corchorus olitorius TaxID=93759 RepID=A0A1R3HEN7_9ROSI|nr:Fatty acyl-CoA reductase [Corchorus olitorius]
MDPVALSNGQGKLTGFIGTLDAVLDVISVVPVDMVVNVSLAAMARHGITRKADINIYHVASSMSNPLTLQNLFELFYQHFKLWPCIDANGKPITVQKLKIVTSMEAFNDYLLREATTSSSPVKKVERPLKFMETAKYMAKCYEPFTSYHYR